ncbi:hypothetical protein ACTFIR_009760 [Dictyostelium discoideum]
MSTTVNNNDASSSSTSASNNSESFDLRMKSIFMKEPVFSSYTNSRNQRSHDDSDTESEQSDDESSNNVEVPTDYQLSDTLLCQYKHMVNNQGLLVEEEYCIIKEVQDLLLDDAIEQVLPNRYSKRVFYSNVFTVPKPGTTLNRPVLDLKRLNTYINDQSFKMEGIKNLPSMVKQGYYMVKLDIKKAYLYVLVDPQYRDLFRFVWKESHYRWKTAPRIFPMLLRPVLRMLRDIKASVIAYLDDLLIVGSTKEECLSNLKKTMDLLVKLGFKLNLEKSVLEPTQSITFLGLQIDSVSMKLLVPKEKKKSVIKEIRNFLKLECCSPRKLAGLKGKLIALKDAVIPFRLYTRQTNKFHSQCLTLAEQTRKYK